MRSCVSRFSCKAGRAWRRRSYSMSAGPSCIRASPVLCSSGWLGAWRCAALPATSQWRHPAPAFGAHQVALLTMCQCACQLATLCHFATPPSVLRLRAAPFASAARARAPPLPHPPPRDTCPLASHLRRQVLAIQLKRHRRAPAQRGRHARWQATRQRIEQQLAPACGPMGTTCSRFVHVHPSHA